MANGHQFPTAVWRIDCSTNIIGQGLEKTEADDAAGLYHNCGEYWLLFDH